jgi:hypothetical protein
MHTAVAGGAIAVAADEPTVCLDFDLQDGGVRGAADGREGLAAAPATARRCREFVLFDNRGQVGVVAAARSRPAGLLAASLSGRGSWTRRGRWGSGAGLGLFAEELLLAETQLSAELFDLLLEMGGTLDRAVVHGLPVGGLSPGLELDGEAWANGTGAVREGRCGAGRRGRRGG